ncbi:unnamed protein product [Bursaphelenchus xylophilus]|uniref:(pine wood nematode) hypothetical protein n=1 Tax=Bursaphelenchus xylophilus TaxID=6326 RepID=A0A1I7RPM0_BURXY|nr:unnamed protein product [Bursaphelenchus xylophilus]CAG9096265.1 unnamed protein product [Bursaphelenchus xylophilus]
MNKLEWKLLPNPRIEKLGETGFVTEPFVDFPVEVIVQLKGLSHISYIQFLVHTQFIPDQLLISHLVDNEFEPVGTVYFKPRESIDGKQEEKKVLLSCKVFILKLTFINAHESEINPENRIGITEMSIYGRDTVTPSKSTLYGNTSSTISIFKPRLPAEFDETVSSVNSLTGRGRRRNRNERQNLDPTTEEIRSQIRQARSAIDDAVRAENFALAKRMQDSKAQLELVLKQLQDATRAKQEAIRQEDYNRAQELTDQINSLRGNAMANVDTNFINVATPRIQPPTPLPIETPQQSLPLPRIEPIPLTPSTLSNNSFARNPPNPERRSDLILPPISPLTFDSSINSQNGLYRPYQRIRRFSDPADYNTRVKDDQKSLASTWSSIFRPIRPNVNVSPASTRFLDKENRPIRPSKAYLNDQNGQALDELTLDQLLDQVNPSDRTHVTRAVNVFGLKPVAEVYSKHFKDRRSGLKKITEAVAISTSNSRDVIRVALPLLVRGLSDKIYRVYEAAVLLLESMLNYISNRNMSNEIPRLADATSQILISRTGDTVTDQRFASKTFEVADSLFKKDSSIGTEFLNKFSQPLKPNQSVRTSRGQAQIVNSGLQSLISQSNRLNTQNLIKFGADCIDHYDGEVRKYGREILMTLYSTGNRKEIRDTVTKDTVEHERSRGLRNILEQFDQKDKDDGITVTLKSPSVRNLPIAPTRGPRTSSNPRVTIKTPSRSSKSSSSRTTKSPSVRRSTGGSRRSTRSEGSRRSRSSHSNTSNKSIKSIVRPPTTTKMDPKNVKIQLDGSRLSDSGTTDYSKVCMYCGVQNNTLNLTGLENHYKNDCPMLTECSHCKEIVETRHLHDHLIHECPNKGDYKECDRCKQAVLGTLYTKHRSSSKCRLVPPNTGRCPLCYQDVSPDNDIGWREHLMKKCKANKRR